MNPLILIAAIIAAGAIVAGLSFSFGVRSAMNAVHDGAARRLSPDDFTQLDRLMERALGDK